MKNNKNRFATRYNNFNENKDFYPTPPEATQALMQREKFNGVVWECACGDGRMAEIIKKYNNVFASDLIDRGYGKNPIDFLNISPEINETENVITNPPYKYAEKFLEQALRVSRKKVAFLLRLTFLESTKRLKIFRISPPKIVYVFSKRLPIYKNGIEGNSGMVAYAWYVWDKDYQGKTYLEWI